MMLAELFFLLPYGVLIGSLVGLGLGLAGWETKDRRQVFSVFGMIMNIAAFTLAAFTLACW